MFIIETIIVVLLLIGAGLIGFLMGRRKIAHDLIDDINSLRAENEALKAHVKWVNAVDDDRCTTKRRLSDVVYKDEAKLIGVKSV